MKSELSLKELSIILAAKELNPTALTVEFFKSSGIVPYEWELAKDPILSSDLFQIYFTNGINIVVQLNTIIFSETLALESKDKEDDIVKISQIAHDYVEILPNLSYQAVAINSRNFLKFFSKEGESPRNSWLASIFSRNICNSSNDIPIEAEVNLVYALGGSRQLNLNICEGNLELPNDTSQFAVLFSGHVPYEINGNTVSKRLEELHQFIDCWYLDFKAFQTIIKKQFLT